MRDRRLTTKSRDLSMRVVKDDFIDIPSLNQETGTMDFSKIRVGIKQLEDAVYPEELRGYANVTSKKEFVKRLRCYDAAQIDYIIDDNFFFLSTIHYNCVYIRDIGISSNNPKKVFGVFKKKKKLPLINYIKTCLKTPLLLLYIILS